MFFVVESTLILSKYKQNEDLKFNHEDIDDRLLIHVHHDPSDA